MSKKSCPFLYCMSRKSLPILFSKLLYDMGQVFLEVQYRDIPYENGQDFLDTQFNKFKNKVLKMIAYPVEGRG